MYWFRTRLRLGSCVALLALALQLVISFGHVHVGALHAQSPASVEATDNTPFAPPGHDGPDSPDHYCAICAVIHLAGTLTLAEPPSIPLPRVLGQWRPDVAVKFGWLAAPPAFFPARAPPVA
jgi:hypothetical protein